MIGIREDLDRKEETNGIERERKGELKRQNREIKKIGLDKKKKGKRKRERNREEEQEEKIKCEKKGKKEEKGKSKK